MNKLCYGIPHYTQLALDGKTPLSLYYKDPVLLGKILKKIQDLRMRYYVDAKGEPMVKWNGDWMGYMTVSKMDKRLEVN